MHPMRPDFTGWGRILGAPLLPELQADVMDDEYWSALPIALTTADVARVLRISENTALRRLTGDSPVVPGYRLTPSSWIVFRDEMRAWMGTVSNQRHDGDAEGEPVDVLAGYPDELGYQDLMELLGKTKPTVYAWLRSGVIPGYNPEGRWVVHRHELRAHLDAVRNIPRQTTGGAS